MIVENFYLMNHTSSKTGKSRQNSSFQKRLTRTKQVITDKSKVQIPVVITEMSEIN